MKKYDKDKKLEQHIIDFLYEECNLSSIVTDCLNYHANDPNHIALKKRNLLEFKNDFGEASGKCIISLKEISNCLSIKDYSKDHLAAHLFLEELKISDYFIYNARVACCCLENSVKQSNKLVCTNEYMDNPLLRGKLAFLSELLIDLSTFINQLYSWKRSLYESYRTQGKIDANSEFGRLFMHVDLPHAIMRKRSSARDILQNVWCSIDRYQFCDNVDAIPVTMFQIRQMIELRLWEIFGIDSIIDDKGDLIKITADKLLSIPGLDQNVDFHAKLSNIKHIHTWTNIYVHAGVSGFHWQIDFAYNYLMDFVLKPAVVDDDYTEMLDEHLNKDLICRVYSIKYRKHKDRMTTTEEKRMKNFEKRLLDYKNNYPEMQQNENLE